MRVQRNPEACGACKNPEAVLAYKKVPTGQFSPETLKLAEGKLKEMGAQNGSRIFHVKRSVKYSKKVQDSLGINSRQVDIFFAVNPCIETELKHAARFMARERCEFPIYAQTDRMTFETKGDSRTYYLVFERGDTTTPSPVMLKADHYATFNHDRLAFVDQVQNLQYLNGEKQLEYFRNILKTIEINFVDGTGVPAQLVWGGRVRWTSGTECGSEEAGLLIRQIGIHGLAGPTFVHTPNLVVEQPGLFEFHGHPAYPDRYLAPPSSVDIDGAGYDLFRQNDHAHICIQAIALQEKADVFRLFLNAYVLGEDWDHANYEPIVILASYLNTVYNTVDKRNVDRYAVNVLRDARRMEQALKDDGKLGWEIDQLDLHVVGRGPAVEQKKQWNLVVSKMNEIYRAAHGKDFIVPEKIWAQRLWNLSGGEIELGGGTIY